MIHPRRIGIILLAAIMAGSSLLGASESSGEKELLNEGKILMFDKKWEEARLVFQRVTQQYPRSTQTPQAYYLMARCLQLQGKDEEAIQGYELFLKMYPNEPFLPAEAHNSIVELAASLLEKGNPSYRDRLLAAMSDPKKEVRYFAAIRSSYLNDRHISSMAVPVLKEIVRKETERELVDRARIALLRLDPKALSPQVESPERQKSEKPRETRMFHIVVYKQGQSQPVVELNIPASLAQLAIAALDESAKKELKKKGIDVDNVWESLKGIGPTNILTFRDGENLIKIWID